MKNNYQKELDKVLLQLDKTEEKPSLLLHSCCAPCSSYVLEYLHSYFRITVYYYNPNITEKADVDVLEGEHDPKSFFAMAAKWPGEKEGGLRCYDCYKMRLMNTAEVAAEKGYDYFTTTLSISPHKNAQWLNELSEEASAIYGVKALPADFKKRNGYKRSIELSAEYDLYRQDYCGCIFSKKEREEQ